MYHALSHFWTRGTPEITYFGRNQSLPTHGVGAVALYAMKGNRIAWFSIMKDEAANADPALEAGQVPNLFIVTRGRGKAKLSDKEIDLREGMSVFVAPYVKHVLWNPYDEPMEGILVLFGDNTDAAFGKSYIDVKEGLHDFYGKFPYRSE
jgi:mannose-6-phosphate isomerase-like protein (cupin superfamily)